MLIMDLLREADLRTRLLTVTLSLVVLAPIAAHAQTKSCFPTCSETDGRFLSLVGTDLESLAGDEMIFSFRVPSSASAFNLEIFDGETGGIWDKGTNPIIYELYADPDNDGVIETGEQLYGPFNGNDDLDDNTWSTISVATSNAARTGGVGPYFYTVRMRLQNPSIVGTWSNFKIRANADILLQTNNFAFAAPLFTMAEANVIYPNFIATDSKSAASLAGSTYDGTWRFFMQVEKAVVFGNRPDTAFVDIWDGDMDFGSYDCTTADTDDPNTPNAPFLPSWAAGTTAVPEGVAFTTEPCRTAAGVPMGTGFTTGDPADDNISPLYRRSPSITYVMTAPNGAVYSNANPSGSEEWERFSASLMGGVPMVHDYQAAALPDGIYEVRVAGMDMNNLNAWHSTFRFVGVCPDNFPCPQIECEAEPVCKLAQGPTSRHRMLLGKDGYVWTWGKNSRGQLGDGSHTERCEPVRVLKGEAPGTKYLGDDCLSPVSGGVGRFHSVVAMSDGSVYSWGSNNKGQLGTGDKHPNKSETPVRVVKGQYSGTTYLGDAAGRRVIQVAAGRRASLALTQDGLVYAWGENHSGELGNGGQGSVKVTAPVRVLKGEYNGTTYLGDNPSNPIIQVSMGDHISVALAQDGTVYTWGKGKDGQLGNGVLADKNLPVRVLKGEYEGTTYLGDAASNPVSMVAAGGHHVLALTSDGRVWSWGTNKAGALGIGEKHTKKEYLPVKVAAGEYTGSTQLGGTAGNPIMFISAGGSNSKGGSFAIPLNGPVYAWGSDHKGKLAIDSKDKRIFTPKRVDDGDYDGTYFGDKGDAREVSGHSDRGAGLVSNCTLYEWGEDKGKLDGNDDLDEAEDADEFDSDTENNDNKQRCHTDAAPDVVTNFDSQLAPKVIAPGFDMSATSTMRISSLVLNADATNLRLDFESSQSTVASIELYTVAGDRVVVMASDFGINEGPTSGTFDLPSALAAGMYIVRVTTPSGAAIHRFNIVR